MRKSECGKTLEYGQLLYRYYLQLTEKRPETVQLDFSPKVNLIWSRTRSRGN